MRIRSIPHYLLVLLALGACSFINGAPRQNLLIIVVNSLRFDAISSCIGAAATPTIDELARDGVTFTNCFAHSSSNLAAHTALLSARAPTDSGILADNRPIATDLPLLAEHLVEQGFSTSAETGLPELRSPVGDPGLERGFQSFSFHESQDARADRVAERTIEFLRGASATKPWFAYVGFSDLTEPYEANLDSSIQADILIDDRTFTSVTISRHFDQELALVLAPGPHRLTIRSEAWFLIESLACRTEEGPLPVRFEVGRLGCSIQGAIAMLENTSDAEIRCTVAIKMHDLPGLPEIRARYKQEVEGIDRALARVVQELKNLGLYDDTLIVLTADHGASLGEHNQIGHVNNLHDEVLRVPLIVKPSVRSHKRLELRQNPASPMRHCDVVPTLMEMLELSALPGATGSSLFENQPRRLLAAVASPARGTVLALRDDRFKLIYFVGQERLELYDMRADSLELDNVHERMGFDRSSWEAELRALAAQPAP